ncbi:MAG: hypothetical protein ACK4XM_12590 [Chloroherpetonaceae bacterium]
MREFQSHIGAIRIRHDDQQIVQNLHTFALKFNPKLKKNRQASIAEKTRPSDDCQNSFKIANFGAD